VAVQHKIREGEPPYQPQSSRVPATIQRAGNPGMVTAPKVPRPVSNACHGSRRERDASSGLFLKSDGNISPERLGITRSGFWPFARRYGRLVAMKEHTASGSTVRRAAAPQRAARGAFTRPLFTGLRRFRGRAMLFFATFVLLAGDGVRAANFTLLG
jgi:hypothetical protein